MASSSTEGPYRLIPLEDVSYLIVDRRTQPLTNSSQCTLDTCDLATRGRINYLPNLAGNDLFIALFAIIFLAQIVLGLWKRTWGFTVGMCAGLILEVVGYAGRVKMHNNPFLKAPFIMYLVCLTLAPAFLSGAIYLCLSRIVVAYDERVSRLKPWQYTAVFMTFDLVSLILQAAGGAMAATGDDQQKVDKGKNIMVAGLAWQVVAMTIFAVICADYARRVGWKSTRSAQRFPELTSTGEFKAFLLCKFIIPALGMLYSSVLRG